MGSFVRVLHNYPNIRYGGRIVRVFLIVTRQLANFRFEVAIIIKKIINICRLTALYSNSKSLIGFMFVQKTKTNERIYYFPDALGKQ